MHVTCAALYWVVPAYAANETLTVGAGAASALSNQPATILFPVMRGSAQAYDTIIGYHAVAGTAVAGADYATPPGTFTLPAAAMAATIPVIVNADTRSGSSVGFQLQLDNAIRVSAPPSFATPSYFNAGVGPTSVTSADINGDGKADLIVADQVFVNAVTVLLNTTAPGAAAPSFAAANNFATGSSPYSVTAADINGDGKADLIAANHGAATASVLLNTTAPGAAVPSFATQQAFAAGSSPSAVTATDINGDGNADLIVANSGGTVSILLNTTAPGAATPSFASQQAFATGTNPMSVAATDVNGDGKADVITANVSSNTISVLLNTTVQGAVAPSFATQQGFATGSSPYSVAAGDVNGDGKSDLIAANHSNNTVSVLLNTTAPGAAVPDFAAQQAFATGSSPYSATAADVNGDGKLDLIAANLNPSSVSVLLNTTAPGAATSAFAAQQTFAMAAVPSSVAATDVNGDGKPDIVTASFSDDTISVLLNTTDSDAAAPVFAAQEAFETGLHPDSVASADVNGDGKADLIAANTDDGTVSVLLNATVPGAATPSFAAQQAFDTEANPILVMAADFSGDGKPDLITTNFSSHTISLLRNTTAAGAATPAFAAQQILARTTAPYAVALADINGDGRADLVVTNYGSYGVSVLLNETAPGAATAQFAAEQYFFLAVSGLRPIVAADLNGDGKVDLIAASVYNSNVTVMLNTTAPGAATVTLAAPQSFPTGGEPMSLVVTDINGDGRADLITANHADETVSVLVNATTPGAATPAFGAQETFATGAYLYSVTTTDINNDGRPDLITTNAADETVSVLLNTTVPGAATPVFAAQQTFASVSDPRSVASADVNGDGQADLITANSYTSDVSVHLNRTYTVPIAGAPATGTITLDKIFHNGIERPLVNCAGTTGYADYLIEDFAGSSLDPLRWAQNANSGTVTVAGNSVALGSSGNQFPFVTSRGAPIPATGSFSIRWNATYTQAASRGDGTLVISKGLPANGPNDSYALRRADTWQDTANGYQLRLRTTDAGAYAAGVVEKPPLLGTHEVEYCWLPATIEYWIDGTRALAQPRDASLSRPDALWFGNPFNPGAPGLWNNFMLDSVDVRSISP